MSKKANQERFIETLKENCGDAVELPVVEDAAEEPIAEINKENEGLAKTDKEFKEAIESNKEVAEEIPVVEPVEEKWIPVFQTAGKDFDESGKFIDADVLLEIQQNSVTKEIRAVVIQR